MEIHPNDPNHGDRHTWDAEAKIEGYRTILPRFSSEFGHQSPPCLATLRAEIPERALSIGSEALRLRQKAWGGDDVQYKPFLEARFRRARGFDEYVAQAQHLQARAMDVAMRWLRANAPRSMGALIWQWNDVWAGHSWSLVDVAGRTKPAWHAVRRACSRALLSIEPTGESGALEVVLMDDAAFVDPMRFARRHHVASIERMDFAGTIRASSVVPLRAAPCGDLPAATMRGMIPAALFDGLDQTRELLVARLRRAPRLSPATWFFADDSCIQLPKPRLRARATVASDGSGFEEFVAQNVIREFWVEAAEREFDRKSGDPFAEELNGENDGDIEVDNRSCWRTLLPGDAVRLMRDSRWWSANSFALQQTR
jgi:beta-mannosidase